MSPGRPLSFPTWRRLGIAILGAIVVSLVFFPIYTGGGSTTGLLGHRLHLYTRWGLLLPFWPPMIVAYLSMFVLFLLPPLQLDERALIELARRLVVASLIGGLVFFTFPSEIGFPEHGDAGIWQPLYDGIYSIDTRANALPSFHVITTATILLAFIDVATPRLRVVWIVWLAVVCASTVLTHRHHLSDVAAGLAIAFAVRALARRRAASRLPLPDAFMLDRSRP
jgi:membrane-associated phospholipid phosphatase